MKYGKSRCRADVGKVGVCSSLLWSLSGFSLWKIPWVICFVSFRFHDFGQGKKGTDAGVMRTVPTHDRCVSAQDEGALGVLTCVFP